MALSILRSPDQTITDEDRKEISDFLSTLSSDDQIKLACGLSTTHLFTLRQLNWDFHMRVAIDETRISAAIVERETKRLFKKIRELRLSRLQSWHDRRHFRGDGQRAEQADGDDDFVRLPNRWRRKVTLPDKVKGLRVEFSMSSHGGRELLDELADFPHTHAVKGLWWASLLEEVEVRAAAPTLELCW